MNEMCSIYKKFCIPPRYVFAFMGFFATVIGLMIGISVNVTLPFMVNQTSTGKPTPYDPFSCPNLKLINESKDFPYEEYKKVGGFDWDAQTQASVAGAYSKAYVMSPALGGIVADVAGGKKILTITFLISGVSTLLLPVASKLIGPSAAMTLRFITGFASGTLIPILMSMMSKWVPHNNRSFIAAIIFPGALIGHVAGSLISQSLIRLVGWEVVYYLFGFLGIIWAAIWTFCGYNTPNDHPNISESEKKHLCETIPALNRTTRYDLDDMPWKAFLRSSPFWGYTVGYIGTQWAFETLTAQIPLYLKEVLQVDIAFSDALLYMPYVCLWISALSFGLISDVLISRGCCSVELVRKYATAVCAIGSGTCIMLVTYSGCNPVPAIFWMFSGTIFFGAYYSGVIINVLEITPNYAGTVISIVHNVAINLVLLWPKFKLGITDVLLYQWRISFWIGFIIIISSLVIFVYYMKAEQEWWDAVRLLGYPENWKHGLLNTVALIGKNGEVVLTPRRDIESNNENESNDNKS